MGLEAFGNTTVDPRSFCRPATQLSIDEILDLDTGEFVKTREFIRAHRYEDVIPKRDEFRRRWRTDAPKVVCSVCLVGVSLVAHTDKSWFFRHAREDDSCPARTRGALTADEIRARKYHGLKESEPHKRFKALLAACLEMDEDFSDVRLETVVRSDTVSSHYRRPDVQARFKGQLAAFEVQLSTTFLDVVIARKVFYSEIQAILLWILPHFDPHYRRLTDDDILFTNNKNVFVLDDETVAASKENGRLMLRCWHRVPRMEGEQIKAVWANQLVPFSEVTFDLDGQQAYWYDYDGAVEALREDAVRQAHAVVEARRLAEIQADDELRNDFEALFLGNWYREPFAGEWQAICGRFTERGIVLPDWPSRDRFAALFNALYSAKLGRSIGWNYPHLLELAHNLHVHYKPFLLHFIHAAAIYGRYEDMKALDFKKKWEEKWETTRKSLAARDPAFFPDTSFHEVVSFLFPAVAEKIDKYLDNTYGG